MPDAIMSTASRSACPLPRVSVLVATRDRPLDLARCLPSVLACEYPDFEVLVVDQGKAPLSVEHVPGLADARVAYVHDPRPGKARALNTAAGRASGELFVLTDDDCTVGPAWLTRAVAPFTHEPRLGVVFAALRPASHDADAVFIPEFLPRRRRRLHGWRGRLACHGVGANMVVRAAVVRRLGGWDATIGPGSTFRSGDDVDLAWRAMHAGFDVLIDPANSVTHHGARSLSDGSVKRLVRNNFYGVGARLAKELRCGDPLAAVVLLRLVAGQAGLVMLHAARERRLTGAGRLLSLLRGFAAGATHPLDRAHRSFVDAP